MKPRGKVILFITFCVFILCSFWVGRHFEEKKYMTGRLQQCETLLSFAIEKAEHTDISDQGVMKALISNVYAAYELCDDAILKNELHNLWNELIFESDNESNINDTTKEKLEDILRKLP